MCLTRDNFCYFSNKITELHNKIKDMPFYYYFIGYISFANDKILNYASKPIRTIRVKYVDLE